jgi:hypothetical protein
MKKIVIFLAIMLMQLSAYATDPGLMEPPVEHTILSLVSGKVVSPLARHNGGTVVSFPEGPVAGWVQDKPDGYISFDADKVFFPEEGTIEIKLAVLDKDGLKKLGNDLDALISLYDAKGTPFFSIGINDHDFAVGSYQLHPVVMEDVFGGVGFPYVSRLSAPLADGSLITVRVTWGKDPSDNRVYINGSLVPIEEIKGPRHMGGPPGYEPTKTLGSFMHGFKVFDGRMVGPPDSLVIGRVGKRNPFDPIAMYPPTSVAIRSVKVWDAVLPPKPGASYGGPQVPGLKAFSLQ